MADLMKAMFGRLPPVEMDQVALATTPEDVDNAPWPTIRVQDLSAWGATDNGQRFYQWHDGEKFPGGYGPTPLLLIDYWTLRERSAELFERNVYARGLIRRLVTAVVGTGLAVEAMPDPLIVGMDEDILSEWSEQVETLFELYGSLPELCDYKGQLTAAQLERAIYCESLIMGDVLVVLAQDKRTKLPRLRVISGAHVQSPVTGVLGKLPNGNRIVHGVEIDDDGRHIAYHVRKSTDEDPFAFKYERIKAFDSANRPIAWLVYGSSDHRFDEVRGQPILSIAIQSLKDIDRYRDSAQRKALISSLLALVVTKKEATVGTGPLVALGGGFKKQGVSNTPEADGAPRARMNIASMVPGSIVDELAQGEDIKALGSGGTDERFSEFEGVIVGAIAWCLEIPPEIAGQKFTNSHSASVAANAEFKIVLDLKRDDLGDQFIKKWYRELLISLVLLRQIQAPGLLESMRDPAQWFVFASWVKCQMSGSVKPNVDPFKLARAYKLMIDMGLITRAKAARETRGGKYSQIVKQLKKENEQLVTANQPIIDAYGPQDEEESRRDDAETQKEDREDEGEA